MDGDFGFQPVPSGANGFQPAIAGLKLAQCWPAVTRGLARLWNWIDGLMDYWIDGCQHYESTDADGRRRERFVTGLGLMDYWTRVLGVDSCR